MCYYSFCLFLHYWSAQVSEALDFLLIDPVSSSVLISFGLFYYRFAVFHFSLFGILFTWALSIALSLLLFISVLKHFSLSHSLAMAFVNIFSLSSIQHLASLMSSIVVLVCPLCLLGSFVLPILPQSPFLSWSWKFVLMLSWWLRTFFFSIYNLLT